MGTRAFWIRLFIGGAILLVASPLHAQATAAPALTWHGLVSLGYTRNARPADSGLNGLRVFDDRDATGSLDVAELVLESRLAAALRVRIDFEVGERIPLASASNGLKLGSRSDLQQAFLSVTSGPHTALDLGKFSTPLGVEVIEGYDGFNDQYSRGLLCNYALPFTHTGARYVIAACNRTRAALLATLGWDNVVFMKDRWAVGAQVAHHATEHLVLTAAAFSGTEPSASGPHQRSVADAIATWRSFQGLVVTTEAVIAREGSLRWHAMAAYLSTPSVGRAHVTTRVEVFDDPDGARLGVGHGAHVGEVTITPSFALNSVLLLRCELRHDRANTTAFPASGGTRRSQTTFSTNLIIHH